MPHEFEAQASDHKLTQEALGLLNHPEFDRWFAGSRSRQVLSQANVVSFDTRNAYVFDGNGCHCETIHLDSEPTYKTNGTFPCGWFSDLLPLMKKKLAPYVGDWPISGPVFSAFSFLQQEIGKNSMPRPWTTPGSYKATLHHEVGHTVYYALTGDPFPCRELKRREALVHGVSQALSTLSLIYPEVGFDPDVKQAMSGLTQCYPNDPDEPFTLYVGAYLRFRQAIGSFDQKNGSHFSHDPFGWVFAENDGIVADVPRTQISQSKGAIPVALVTHAIRQIQMDLRDNHPTVIQPPLEGLFMGNTCKSETFALLIERLASHLFFPAYLRASDEYYLWESENALWDPRFSTEVIPYGGYEDPLSHFLPYAIAVVLEQYPVPFWQDLLLS